VLPLRWPEGRDPGELTAYLRRMAGLGQVIVVDGLPAAVFARHHRAWAAFARHMRPDGGLAYRNGKANGVITGVRAAGGDRVIIADDDVRYDDRSLALVLALLDDADLVIPQNYFSPLPWHAAWDSARTLVNRALGLDYPALWPSGAARSCGRAATTGTCCLRTWSSSAPCAPLAPGSSRRRRHTSGGRRTRGTSPGSGSAKPTTASVSQRGWPPNWRYCPPSPSPRLPGATPRSAAPLRRQRDSPRSAVVSTAARRHFPR
jgi:hypothetical protein